MQFSLAFASLVASALATPMPQAEKSSETTIFQLMALRSASPVHFARFGAANSNLYLNLEDQNASRGPGGDGSATFQLTSEGELFLYSTDNPRQQIYADRSGMGQGKLGYVTGAQGAPRNAELDGWELDEYGNLSLEGAGFLACPNDDGSYALWISAGIDEPAGHKGCLGVSARSVTVEDPVSCLYTS